MGQNTPSIKLPFTSFPNLDSESSRRIWRDFEEVVRNIPTTPSVFDAIIDPALSASVPASHQYKNLTDLVANETWASRYTFVVGVKQRATVAIVEPAGVSIASLGSLALFGTAIFVPDEANTFGWQGLTIGLGANNQLFAYNLVIDPVGATNPISNGTSTGLSNWTGCYFGANIADIGGNEANLTNCRFGGTLTLAGSAGTQINRRFYDCVADAGVTAGNQCAFDWLGGKLNFGITLSGSTNGYGQYVTAELKGNATNISSSHGANIVVNNTGNSGGALICSTTACPVYINGPFAAVTFSGTPSQPRFFDGVVNSMDFTGPGICKVQEVLSGGAEVKLRGSGVFAEVSSPGGVQCLALLDSLVMLDFSQTSSFSLDASSLRNLVILAGSGVGGWGGTTDAGKGNRIITEQGDLFGGVLVSPVKLRGKIVQTPPPDDDQFPEWGPFGPDIIPGPRGKTGAPGGPIICTSGTRPGGTQGKLIYETDTGKLLEYQGATDTWTPPWNTAWGLQGSVGKTTNDQTLAVTPTVTAITGASVTWTAVANRTYKVTWSLMCTHNTDGAGIEVFAEDGSSAFVSGSDTSQYAAAAGANFILTWSYVETGLPAGSTTRKLVGRTTVNTGTLLGATNPGSIFVEDIGPNGVPS